MMLPDMVLLYGVMSWQAHLCFIGTLRNVTTSTLRFLHKHAQNNFAHTQLVTCDSEIEIMVTVSPGHMYTCNNFAPVVQLSWLAPARPIASIRPLLFGQL